MIAFRILAFANITAGILYLGWRYTASLNFDPRALWFSLLLVGAETYSFIDTMLFILMMWKPRRRKPPEPLPGKAVDIFITTYNEPVDLVRLTAEAALRIDWQPKHVYVLDDGARPEMAELCREISCGYIMRGEEWRGKPRHAKAGNVNNALIQTSGEFILILDSDQIPAPQILNQVMGYFHDPKLAFVQTPQYFYNLPPGDPFGSDAPLFYGPMMQGKDGWNAAFFCGSNAVLRREALMQIGLAEYATEVEKDMQSAIGRMRKEARRPGVTPAAGKAARIVLSEAARRARGMLAAGEPLEKAAEVLRQGGQKADDIQAEKDLEVIARELASLGEKGDTAAREASRSILWEMSTLAGSVARATSGTDSFSGRFEDERALDRSSEAMAVSAFSTISVTEDMATALRLHARGWSSVFHPEILAYGLAPEDLGTALNQRLRWAQGTLQVLFREKLLFRKGLTLAQRLQYFTTIYSYFSGFAHLIYVFSPIFFLVTGIAPVNAWTLDFVFRFVPFFIVNKAMYRLVTSGLSTRRTEQYTLCLYPLWIRAVLGAIFNKSVRFIVTPKGRQNRTSFSRVSVQAVTVVLTLAAVAVAVTQVAVGAQSVSIGILMNVGWALYNVTTLTVILRAVLYKAPKGWSPKPPAFLFPAVESKTRKRRVIQ